MKNLPCYGKLYISTNHVSFNSKGYVTKAKVQYIWSLEEPGTEIDAYPPTQMIIPFSDIMRIQKIRSRGYIFHALSILTQNKKEVSSVNEGMTRIVSDNNDRYLSSLLRLPHAIAALQDYSYSTNGTSNQSRLQIS